MKKHPFKKVLLTLLSLPVILSLPACSSIDLGTNPFESPDEADIFQKIMRSLGAHDCRQHEECKKLCPFEEKKLKEQKIADTERWEKFSTMAPYKPARCGSRLIDAANDALAPLSAQIIEEVIKPYVELDKEGHLVAYRTFLDEVNLRIELKKEKGIDLSFSDSVKQTAAFWQVEYGEKQYQAFLNALPFVERMQAGNQIAEAIPGLLSSAVKILATIDGKGVSELVQDMTGNLTSIDAWMKRAEIAAALAGTATVCKQLIEGLTFMAAIESEHSDELDDIENALSGVNESGEL